MSTEMPMNPLKEPVVAPPDTPEAAVVAPPDTRESFASIWAAANRGEHDIEPRLARWVRDVADQMGAIRDVACLLEFGNQDRKIRGMAEDVYLRLTQMGFDFAPGPSQYP